MRMDPVRAGLLGGWKERLTHSTAIRVAHAAQTLKSVEGSCVQAITPNPRGRSVYLRLPLLLRSKEEKEALCRTSAEQGLGMSSMYPSSIEDIPELHDMISSQHVPQSAMIAERLITLPTHEFLSSNDRDRIRRAIEQVQQAEEAPTTYPSLARTQKRTVSELPRAN